MKKHHQNNIFKPCIYLQILFSTLILINPCLQTAFDFYTGKSIAPAALADVQTPTGPNIDIAYNQDHTITVFHHQFNVDAAVSTIVVNVKTRGGSQVLVALREGSVATSVFSSGDGEVLNLDTTNFDFTGAKQVEDYHMVTKTVGTVGVLSIICHEPIGNKQSTLVNIKSVAAPSGTSCAYPCEKGSCTDGKCKCPETHFGVQCNKELRVMDKDASTFSLTLNPFNAVTIMDDATTGDKKVKVTLVSEAKPKATLLINEAANRDPEAMMHRKKDDKASVLLKLEKLTTTSKEIKEFILEKNFVFITIQNHFGTAVTMQVTVESKFIYF